MSDGQKYHNGSGSPKLLETVGLLGILKTGRSEPSLFLLHNRVVATICSMVGHRCHRCHRVDGGRPENAGLWMRSPILISRLRLNHIIRDYAWSDLLVVVLVIRRGVSCPPVSGLCLILLMLHSTKYKPYLRFLV